MKLVSTVVSSVFSAIGLSSSAGTAPEAPVDTPAMWAMLAWARRQFGQPVADSAQARTAETATSQSLVAEDTGGSAMQTFAALAAPAVNTAPTASLSSVGLPDQSTGVVSGVVTGSDADGNTLSYSVAGTGPASGSVTVNQQTGAFTYTPTLAARLAAAQTAAADFDSFGIAVSDGQASTMVAVGVPVLPTAFSSPTSTQVGFNPMGVAVSTTKTYVANSASNTLSVIDRSTGAVTNINVIGTPTAVALSADGSRAYVAGNNGVSVINTATNQATNTVVTNGGQSFGIAVSPNGQRVYVTNTANNTVSVINTTTATPSVIATVAVGFTPAGVTVSPDGQRVYVANYNSNSVSVINTSTNAVTGSPIAVGANPVSVAVSADGTRAYVTNLGSNSVSVINTSTNTVVGSPIAVGPNPFGLAVGPDGSVVYAANANDTVSVINTKAGAVITTLTIDSAPEYNWHGVAVSSDGRQLYVSDMSDRVVRTLTLNTPAPANRAPVAGTPSVGTPNATTGAVTGSLNFTDPDGNSLTYSFPTQPPSGTVTVTATGSYTYTPTAAARNQAAQTSGTDLASVTIIASDGQASTPVTFTVPISPAAVVNTAPTASLSSVGTPNLSTGVVSGVVTGSDPDGNTLSYTVGAAPTSGSVTVNQQTGAFTYTPTLAGRLAAGQTTAADSDTFKISVSDGLASTSVTVNVTVSPMVVGNPVSSSVGANPIGVAVSPTRTYVANSASNTLSVIDASTGAVTKINVIATPTAVALNADGSRAYVAGNNGVSVINTATNQVISTVMTNGGQSFGIAVSPNGQRVYVTNTGNNTVSVINTAATTPSVIANVSVGVTPSGVTVSPDGQRVYVVNYNSNSVSVINTSTNTVTGSPIAVGANPVSVAVTSDGTRAYVTNLSANSVSVINTSTNTVTGNPIAVGPNPFGLAISPDGSVVYAANANDTVSVINTKTGAVITTVTIDGAPEMNWHGIAVSPDGRQIYVSDMSDGAVRMLAVNPPGTAAPNRPPLAGTPTVGTPNAATGVVTGSLNFTDPDGDPLTYTVSAQPASGTVTVTSVGTYTYTPTTTARTQAAQTTAADAASITVVASDGKASTSVTFSVPISPTPPVSTPPPTGATPIFVGDYSTGNFSQWDVVQNKYYNSVGSGYTSTYSAAIVSDPTYGEAARYEVRAGDVPNFGGGERSEVQAGDDTGGTEGQIRWYEFATKFDSNFPMNHASLGWGLVNQWHGDSSVGSPPVGWYVDQKNGYWSLVIHQQSAPGQYIKTFSIYDAPLNPGVWQDVKMEVMWSASDSKGFIRLWMNGQRVTFANGQDTYYVRTLIPGGGGVYYKEGYYRQPMSPTGVVYHAGFRVATTEAGLYSTTAPNFVASVATGSNDSTFWMYAQ